MTDLRTAAQQALEALRHVVRQAQENLVPTIHYGPVNDVMNRLEAALAEPAQQGCDHCNHPLYAAVKCRVCGRVTEPVQEPCTYKCETWPECECAKPWQSAPPQRPAEPVQEPDSPERRCGGPGCDMTCCQPVQEPVGAVLVNRESREGVMFYSVDMTPDPSTLKDRFELVPVYTAPPQRKPLAEWQINDLMADIDPEDRDSWSFRQGVYAAEKHHGVRK